jgi:hypothetical protein
MPLPYLSCNRCGHRWLQRKEGLPGTCPKCNSPYWNKKRVMSARKILDGLADEKAEAEEDGSRR